MNNLEKTTKTHKLTLANGKNAVVILDKPKSCEELSEDLKGFKLWVVKSCCEKPIKGS